jgi:CRISPR-associated protein Cas5 subtype I-A
MPYVVFLELEAPFGVSVFYPATVTSSRSYPLPPPTTLAGALAYPRLRLSSRSEDAVESGRHYSATVRILDEVKYAAAGALGYIESRDTERGFQLIYQRRQRWDRIDLAYTVGVRGVVFYLDDVLYALYVVRSRELASYAYGLTRLGRKESHVITRRVVVRALEEVLVEERERFETPFYYPADVATCKGGIVMDLPVLHRDNFTPRVSPITKPFCVPRGSPPTGDRAFPLSGELTERGLLISVEGVDIPVPREVVTS